MAPSTAIDPATTRPTQALQHSPSSSLLRLPAELRAKIFELVLTLPPKLPEPRKLHYICPHVHLWSTSQPFKCTHSNIAHDTCGHVEFRVPIFEDNQSRDPFWSLLLSCQQIYWEAAGMVSGLNTVTFYGIDDLHCFTLAQRAARMSATHVKGLSHLRNIRSVEIGLNEEVNVRATLRYIVAVLQSMPALESIKLLVQSYGAGDVAEDDLLMLTRVGILPKLRTCELVVMLDKNGPCAFTGCHRRDDCHIWKALVTKEMICARQINDVFAEALAKRSAHG